MTRTRLLAFALALASASGCAAMRETRTSLIPTRYQTRTGPYTVATNFPIAADAPAIRQLQALERQVESELGLRVDPETAPIEVYILDDRPTFAHFLGVHYPELPPRRAFFLAQGERRVVYTYLGERLEEDLRHEATHALLHAAAADLPLWLDEGLAEYFEVVEGQGGRNAEHLGRLPDDLAAGWSPDLKRLESIEDVRLMSPRDYREAWLWTHYLLNGSPGGKKALLGYLGELRGEGPAGPLSDRIGARGDALVAHSKQIERMPVALEARDGATVRLQDEPETGRRRGFFGWVRDLFGR